MRMNPDDNLENLPEDYIESVLNTLSHRQQKRFRFGEFLDDIEGALWTYDIIDKYRVAELPLDQFGKPALKTIVTAIDPSGTSTQSSDEAGIVTAGIGYDGHFYVLDDVSGIMTPNQWATNGIRNLYKWEGDRIVAETNQVGHGQSGNPNIDKTVRVMLWQENKFARADPLSGYMNGVSIMWAVG